MSDTFQDALRAADWPRVEELVAGGWLERSALGLALYYLADSEQTSLLRMVLEAGADPDHRSSPRPLQLAAKAGRSEHVALLLQHGADPGAGTSIVTPLSDAIDASEDRCAAMLVRAGAPLELRGGWSALVRAAFRGLPETVRAVLERGGDVESRDSIEAALLRLKDEIRNKSGMAKLEALAKGFGEVETHGVVSSVSFDPRRLVDAVGRDPEQPAAVGTYASSTAAIVAAGEGHREVLETLVDAGADLSACDDSGLTPKQAAVAGGHPALAEWIVERGGGAPSMPPEKALPLAIEAGDLDAVNRLLEGGADVDARDVRRRTAGRTPLITALVAGQQAITERLLNAGADPERRDAEKKSRPPYPLECVRPQDIRDEDFRRWMTPLMFAATLDQGEAVQRLAALGVDLDARDVSRRTALMMAATNGCAAATRALLEAGAGLHVSGPNRESALSLAVGYDHSECATVLLAAGGDADEVADGQPLLHQAILLGNDAIVGALLDAGADPTARNYSEQTPAEYARSNAALGLGRLSAKTLQRLEGQDI